MILSKSQLASVHSSLEALVPAFYKLMLLPLCELDLKRLSLALTHDDLAGVIVLRAHDAPGADHCHVLFLDWELLRNNGLQSYGTEIEIAKDCAKLKMLYPSHDEAVITYRLASDGGGLAVSYHGIDSPKIRTIYGVNVDTPPVSHLELTVE